jgi:PiT family inorganic phosphate transporter
VSSTAVYVPLWVKLSAALAIALGTYLGGWRIIRTMGKGLVDISSPQGLAADSVLRHGHPRLQPARLRPLHHPRRHRLDHGRRHRQEGRHGALVGGRPDGRRVGDHLPGRRGHGRDHVLDRSPASAGIVGPFVVFAILCGLSFYMWKRSRHNVIDHRNVNDEWHDGSKPEVAVAAHDIIDPHHELDEPQPAGPAAH